MAILQRIRGQEGTIRIGVLSAFGVNLPLAGSFFKMKDFNWSVDDEITKDGFIGEVADDLDHIVHGHSGNFTIDKADGAALAYTKALVFASLSHSRPPIATIMVNYKFRAIGVPREKLIFSQGILRMATETIGGRKEFITNAFEWSAKFLLP